MKRRAIRWLYVFAMLLLAGAAQPALAADKSEWGMGIAPADQSVDVAPDTRVVVTFSGPIRLTNHKEPTKQTWTSLIQLTDGKKRRVPFTVEWDKAKRVLTIDPVGNLEPGQSFTVKLPGRKVKNDRGQVNPEVSATFSTKKPVDTIAPRATILPGHGAKQVKLQEKVTLQFAEEVRLAGGAVLASKTAGPLVRVTDDAGVNVVHTVTWNKSKRMLTIKPKGKWQPFRTYQVELLPGLLQDAAGNGNAAQRSNFTTGVK